MATVTETSTEAPTRAATGSITYEDLYRRWELSNWRATEIDFGEDRRQWREELSEAERRAALWNYSLFFHGEDSVTDNLSPFIDAAPREEQKYFLATQQVDEARHAVFFARFMREVVGMGGDSVATALDATHDQLSWGFRKIFGELDRVSAGLRKDRSLPRLAAAVALYHLVIEASMAQPAQHYFERWLEERGVLPGFLEGMRNVSLDEQRHIGFGVKLLSDLVAEDPECAEAVADLMRDIQPYDVAVLAPPGWDVSYVEALGFTMEDIYEEGARSFESKMRAAGLPLDDLPGGSPQPTELTPYERGKLGIDLLRAGVLGEGNGPASKDPEVMRLLFEHIHTAVDDRRLPPGGLTVQWDFADADPWFVRFANGSSKAEQTRVESADITLRCSWDDWCDVAAGRTDPVRSIATRKLRPSGSPRALWRASKLFAR